MPLPSRKSFYLRLIGAVACFIYVMDFQVPTDSMLLRRALSVEDIHETASKRDRGMMGHSVEHMTIGDFLRLQAEAVMLGKKKEGSEDEVKKSSKMEETDAAEQEEAENIEEDKGHSMEMDHMNHDHDHMHMMEHGDDGHEHHHHSHGSIPFKHVDDIAELSPLYAETKDIPDLDLSDINIVAFGTSRTYGVGLPNRTSQAFPYLLNQKAVNLAMRASGPEYPALCAETMLAPYKDEVFDVILLEYNLQANEYLLQLSTRLRQRFPNSIIIFVHVWLPSQFLIDGRNLKQEVQQRRLITSTAKDYHNAANPNESSSLRKLLTESSNLEFVRHPHVCEAVRAAAAASGAYVIELQAPDLNPRDTLLQHLHLFQNDLAHYSTEGHKYVAHRVQEILQHAQVATVAANRVANEWETTDECKNWLTGSYDWRTTKHSKDLEWTSFSNNQSKHSVQLSLDKKDEPAWMTVRNTNMEAAANVYVAYMASGDETIYPMTRAWLAEDKEEEPDHHAVLVPIDDNYPKDYPVHVTKTTLVGELKAGETRQLLLQPMEDSTSGAQEEFRWIGVIVTGADVLRGE